MFLSGSPGQILKGVEMSEESSPCLPILSFSFAATANDHRLSGVKQHTFITWQSAVGSPELVSLG